MVLLSENFDSRLRDCQGENIYSRHTERDQSDICKSDHTERFFDYNCHKEKVFF